MGMYDTQSQMAGFRYATPTINTDVAGITRSGQMIGEALKSGRIKELENARIAEDQRRWDLTEARSNRAEQRDVDRINREINKDNAQNEALRATLNPNEFKQEKLAAEKQAFEQSIAGLSPQEQESLRSQYNPEASGKQWIDVTKGNGLVDQGRLADAKSRQYEIAAKTPGTPEYIAAEKARMDVYKQEQDIAHRNRLGEIGAQSGAQMAYLKATQDAPQKMVNPNTGEAKYVKPSELDKYQGYMDASTYSATLSDKREREEKDRKYAFDVSQAANKAKGELADTLQGYDNESRNAVITSTADANSILKEYKLPGLSNADISALVKRSKGLNLPLTRSDLNTDLFRESLAGEISQKTGRPYEEILNRLEGIEKTQTKSNPVGNDRLKLIGPEFNMQD